MQIFSELMEPLEILGRDDPKSMDTPLGHQGPLQFRKYKVDDPWNVSGGWKNTGTGFLLFSWDVSWKIKNSLSRNSSQKLKNSDSSVDSYPSVWT